MKDLFKAAGIDATKKSAAASKTNTATRQPPPAREERRSYRTDDSEDESYGGHKLRPLIPTKSRDPTATTLHKPRSALGGGPRSIPAAVMELAEQDDEPAEQDEHNYDDNDGVDDMGDDDADDMDESDPEDESDDSNDDVQPVLQPNKRTKKLSTTTSVTPQTHPTPPTNEQPQGTPPTNAQPQGTTRSDSALSTLALSLLRKKGFTLARELEWQAGGGTDNAKQKAFRQDVTQQVDLVALAFMRPSSPYIQVLHSIATYAVRGGDSELHNKDFGYVGDRTTLRTPTPVLLDDKVWKWVVKKVVLDIGPLELFYANPTNAKLLYAPADGTGGVSVSVPRILYLPPPFLTYCLETQRRPFDLHQFVTQYCTRPQSEITIQQCDLMTNWCITAAHRATAPTTSILALTLETAPSDDDDFLYWLNKINVTSAPPTATAQPLLPTTTAAPPTPQPIMASPAVAQPTQDLFKKMAESITKFATAAASMKQPVVDANASYEDGGLGYDEFQMAVIQGFAHVDDITGVPIIWALFQYTKNLDTHKENLKRKMAEWATSTDREVHVPIDRSLYIPHSTMREILSLNFNPGGVSAESEQADQGLSILICRARTNAQKAAIKKYERAAEKSKRNWSMADAAGDDVTAYDTGALPDDYNELLRCLGTYCALLYALFGKRCPFYRHCYALWTMLNSDLVCDKRDKFSALGCRQIVWAIIEESRIFFSKRLAVDDFLNAQHPDDIPYPMCSLANIVQNVRDSVEVNRLSFPPQWIPGGRLLARTGGGFQAVEPAPVQSIAGGGTTPSVVSGITTGSTARQSQRPPITIRSFNVHPAIKATMEPFIAKFKGVYLTPMLTHINQSIDDLPKLAPEVSGANGICYNYILGHCVMDNCRHMDGHVNARDVTDEFATELLNKLRPAITEFMANGLPPRARRRNRRRRRD